MAAPMRGFYVEGDRESTGKKLKRRFVRPVEERSDINVTLKKDDGPSASSPSSPPPPPPPSSAPSSAPAPAPGSKCSINLMKGKQTTERDIFTFEDSQAVEDVPSPPDDFKSKSQSVDFIARKATLLESVDPESSTKKSKKRINEDVEDIMDTDEEDESHTVSCGKVIPSSSNKLTDVPRGRLSKILKSSSPKTSPAISRIPVHDAVQLESVHEHDVPAYLSSTSNWATVWRALKLAGWYFKKGTGLVDGHYLRPGKS